ncbi:MAG: hypothetical protein Q8L74_11615 [Nitrospirota bacterium]|nr:hypothetical protein [Nitrospirota bacterium]MDP2383881.1 hypothetical protein [Nitrospirota bacterium]MDP3597556.1 hypothetical protein [Nitrospirota bacterium]
MKMRTLNATSIVAGVMIGLLAACGVVGPPVPPENVGVNATIQLQKKRELLELKRREAAAAAESGELPQDPMLQGQDVNLPPLRPVGTR